MFRSRPHESVFLTLLATFVQMFGFTRSETETTRSLAASFSQLNIRIGYNLVQVVHNFSDFFGIFLVYVWYSLVHIDTCCYVFYKLQLTPGLFWYRHHLKMQEMVSEGVHRLKIGQIFAKLPCASFVVRKIYIKNAKTA